VTGGCRIRAMSTSSRPITLSFDNQLIGDPAYNHDRGPVDVVTLRLHLLR
jgi:hypothetical protein